MSETAGCPGGVFKLFSTAHSPQSSAGSLRICCAVFPSVGCRRRPRPTRTSFASSSCSSSTRHSFDVRSVKKTCVHIVHPDGRPSIPFDTYNLFYRDDLEMTRLNPLRRAIESTPFVASATLGAGLSGSTPRKA